MFNFLHTFSPHYCFWHSAQVYVLQKATESASGKSPYYGDCKEKELRKSRGLSLLNWDKPQGLYVWFYSNKHIKVFGKLMWYHLEVTNWMLDKTHLRQTWNTLCKFWNLSWNCSHDLFIDWLIIYFMFGWLI